MKKVVLILLCVIMTNSQLSTNDISYMKSTILEGQNKKTKLFFDSFDKTSQAISILLNMKEKVPYAEKICDELQKDGMKPVTLAKAEIYSLLKCDFDLSKVKIDISSFANWNLEEFYNQMKAADLLKLNPSWENLNELLPKFLSKNKFSLNQNEKNKSLFASAMGIDIMGIFYKHLNKEIIKSDLGGVINSIQSAYQELSDDTVIYNEKGISNYKLNYLIISSLLNVKDISNFSHFDETMYKLLNYFLNFKYEFYSLENMYYLTSIYKLLNYIPSMELSSHFYNYLDNNEIIFLRFIDGMNIENKIYNSTLTYEVKKIKKNINFSNKNSLYLEDEGAPQLKTKKTKELKEKTNSTIPLELADIIKEPGEYRIKITYQSQKFKFPQKKEYIIKSYSKVKINHLLFEFENEIDNSFSEKMTQIDYPSRSYRSLKANQDSIIRVKVKLDYVEDKKTFPIDQILLRLKHTELNKEFSVYVSDYSDGYYYINFAMHDPINMESYNGIYDLILIVSDTSFEAPIFWNFGKINISFRKPNDPHDEPNYKNAMKQKMEPTFSPEVQLNKNRTFSMIFCGIILVVFCGLIFSLKKANANICNFPKGSIFSVLFILLLFIFTYILVMFWIKFNILQTMGIFIILALPGGIVVYNAMKNVQIDI